jgi:hypothetical protein
MTANITTFPSIAGGAADLRALSSGDIVAVGNDAAQCAPAAPPCNIPVSGTTVEEPAAQPDGGGLNTTLTAGTITVATPLAPGASVTLQFLLGVQLGGGYRFFVNVEALP